MSKLLRIQDVLAITGIGRSTLYRQIAAGKFPSPRTNVSGVRVSVWDSEAVLAWVDQVLTVSPRLGDNNNTKETN